MNIPSGHNDVAAVLVFATTLKEEGLEILSELHVYKAGAVIVEKWQIVGESQRTNLLPKEFFRAINITKVRVDGPIVKVEFKVPLPAGKSGMRVKEFDFSCGESQVRMALHPLLENR